MRVSFNGLDLQYQRQKAAIDACVQEVLAAGWYIGGPKLEAFEQAFARFSRAEHAVGVANGTDALALALRALQLPKDAEVIVPAVSAYPTAIAVWQAGATPVAVDVGASDGLMRLDAAEAALTPRTRVIMPVHLYGNVCDMPGLQRLARRHGLHLVEDCAQAHGASHSGKSAGSFGALAGWSFYPTKNLGAVGDAGAVTTQDSSLAERLRRLRNYGQSNRYEHKELGVNSRLDPLQAAILTVKLHALSAETERRREIGARYDAALGELAGLTLMRPASTVTPSRHLYALRLAHAKQRAAFQEGLAKEGVESLIHYPIAMPDQVASRGMMRTHGDLAGARALCDTVVSLPIHPDLSDAQVQHVIEVVPQILAEVG